MLITSSAASVQMNRICVIDEEFIVVFRVAYPEYECASNRDETGRNDIRNLQIASYFFAG
jgi:hypothetical protein